MLAGGAEEVEQLLTQQVAERLLGAESFPDAAGGIALVEPQVRADDVFRVAVIHGTARVEPERFVAEAFHEIERMRDEQDRLVAAAKLRELVEALVRERLVADGEHFVHEQHVGIHVNRDREAETHIHAGGVGLHRRVDELAQLGEVHDVVEPILDLALRQAEHDAVDEDVLAPRDLGMEAGAELDERGDPSLDADRAARRLRNAGDELERRTLARSVAADHAVGRSLRDGE